MKKSIVLLLVMIALVGCFTLNSMISDLRFADGDTQTDGEEEVDRGSESDSGSDQNMDISAFLSPELQFSMYYGTYFSLGGYGFGDENFRDGEGIKWSVSTNSETDSIIITRAKLKTLGDSFSWWYFSTEIEGKENFYEILIKNDSDLVKVRYLDTTTGSYGEFIPEDSQERGDEAVESLNSNNYSPYIVGSESLKTRAGTFRTDHIVLEEEGSSFKYEYWISDRAPGHIVKYRYENKAENQIMTGEIIDIRGGYKTKLSSY